MSKKLLITGAYGLVGSNICKILERDYPDIEIRNIKCMGDLMDGDLLTWKEFKTFDYIIHAAGYGQPQMFGKDKIKTIQINTNFTDTLFDFLKKDGKFLFISTSEVYSGAPAPHTEDMIGTTTPQHPRACYIEGKRCGEAICMAYKEQGYDVKIARLALAYGPGTKKGDTRAINQFIEQALTTGKISMKDSGQSLRTYVYVEDAAEMLLDVLFKGKEVVYNIGGESRVKIENLAGMILYELGGGNVYGHNEGIYGAPDDVALCLNRINNEFPRTFVTLEEGLKKTIEYQKQLYGIN